MSPGRAKQKMPPTLVECRKCGLKKARATYLRTTHDGRICDSCEDTVITCHYCWKPVCDWKDPQAPDNAELEYMPISCPNCGNILQCR
jgi:hypothetical protein